jgi:sugar/nucleoside kinase (ribokinase family)
VKERTLDVVGIGNAIVDVLSEADDRFLDKHGLAKGVMTLIDAERGESLYAAMSGRVECSGGSAANTMVGIASLGGAAAYIGKVHDDTLGHLFARDIRAAGVDFRTPPSAAGPPSGRCLVLVTPDAQRTMQTYLGASATLAPDDLDEEAIASAAVTYLEGYLWDPPPAKEAFLAAAAIAHGAGRQVALTLSDAFCVERHRSEFRELLGSHVDILLANEDEILSLYETEDFDGALNSLRSDCRTGAVTRGAQGSAVVVGGNRYDVPAAPVARVVDTTGAGDLFAAGFLHGLTRGMGPANSARIGSIAASEIISHFGARPERSLATLVAESNDGRS